MPLTAAAYSNQNSILDSHNTNTNNNSYYVQKQVATKNTNDSNLMNDNCSNNENEAKNETFINSDVQCWIDFVMDCSSKKSNESKNSKSNQFNKNDSYQQTSSSSSSTFYNPSSTISRDESYINSIPSNNNAVNNKNIYYPKSNINNNSKMRSPTSIQNLCNSRDEENNYLGNRRPSQDYAQISNNQKCSFNNSNQDSQSNLKSYPRKNSYSYTRENEFSSYDYNQQCQNNNPQQQSQSYYLQSFPPRSRSHSQPQVSQQLPYPHMKSRSQTQSPVYPSFDLQQNNSSYSFNDQVQKKLQTQSKPYLSSNSNLCFNNNKSNSYHSMIQSPSNSSISSPNNSVANDRSIYDNNYYDKSTESETYYSNSNTLNNSSPSSPNYLPNQMDDSNLDKKYQLPDIQSKTSSYKSPPQNLSSYHLQSQSNNSMRMDYNNNNNNGMNNLSLSKFQNENKTFQDSNTYYSSSNTNQNDYRYAQSRSYNDQNSSGARRNSNAFLSNYDAPPSNQSSNQYYSYQDKPNVKENNNLSSPALPLRSLVNESNNSNNINLEYKRKNSITKQRQYHPNSAYNNNTNDNRIINNNQDQSIYSNNNSTSNDYYQNNNYNNNNVNNNSYYNINANNNTINNSDNNINSYNNTNFNYNGNNYNNNNNNNNNINNNNNNYNSNYNSGEYQNQNNDDYYDQKASISKNVIQNSSPIYPAEQDQGYEKSTTSSNSSNSSSNLNYNESYTSNNIPYDRQNLGLEHKNASSNMVNHQSTFSSLHFPVTHKVILKESDVLGNYNNDEVVSTTNKKPSGRKSTKKNDRRKKNVDNKESNTKKIKSKTKETNFNNNDNDNDNNSSNNNYSINNGLLLFNEIVNSTIADNNELSKNSHMDSILRESDNAREVPEALSTELKYDNEMEEEITEFEDNVSSVPPTKGTRRSSRIKSNIKNKQVNNKVKNEDVTKISSKNNKNEDSSKVNYKSKNSTKINSSTKIKISSNQINKVKEENNIINTRSTKRNGVASHNSKELRSSNSNKKADPPIKIGKDSEEKKISIIIKKSLIDAAGISKTNHNNASNAQLTINYNNQNSKSPLSSKKSSKGSNNKNEVIDSKSIDRNDALAKREENSPSKNIIPIKITKNIKNKLKITVGKEKKDITIKKSNSIENEVKSLESEKRRHSIGNAEVYASELGKSSKIKNNRILTRKRAREAMLEVENNNNNNNGVSSEINPLDTSSLTTINNNTLVGLNEAVTDSVPGSDQKTEYKNNDNETILKNGKKSKGHSKSSTSKRNTKSKKEDIVNKENQTISDSKDAVQSNANPKDIIQPISNPKDIVQTISNPKDTIQLNSSTKDIIQSIFTPKNPVQTISNSKDTVQTISNPNDAGQTISNSNDAGQRLDEKEKEDKGLKIKDVDQSDDKILETSSSYESIKNLTLPTKPSTKISSTSLQTPPETPSSICIAPPVTTSSAVEIDDIEKENHVLHELGMDDLDDSNSELSSLSDLDYNSSDSDPEYVDDNASVDSLFSDNSSLSSISTMSFSSSISTKSRRSIKLQDDSVDLLLPNDDDILYNETIDNTNINNKSVKNDHTVTFTTEKVTRKRRKTDEKQLKPAIKMNNKKIKTDKEVTKNVSISDVVQINGKDTNQNNEVSSIDKKGRNFPLLNSTSTITVMENTLVKNTTSDAILGKDHNVGEEFSEEEEEEDISIPKSKKRRMSISEISDSNSSDSRTDDQKDSLYHAYLAIGEIVKTDPLFMDLTLEERIKLRRRQRNSKDTILSFEDFNLEDLEKYKTMRNNHDPSLQHQQKRKTRGKKGSNDESYAVHSIESIVAKNKFTKNHSVISDRYNLQTLLKSGTDIEAYSVYKKPKPSKNKKQDIHSKSTNKIISSSKDEEKLNNVEKDIKPETELENKEDKNDVIETKEIINNDSKLDESNDVVKKEEVISKSENDTMETAENNKDEKSAEEIEDIKLTDENKDIKSIEETKDIKPIEGLKNIKSTEETKDIKVEEETKDVKVKEEAKDIKIEEQTKDIKIKEQTLTKFDDKKTIEALVKDKFKEGYSNSNIKLGDIKISESTPASPVTQKRKRGRPARASKSNTTSPYTLSPANSKVNSLASSHSIKFDYALYGYVRSSRRTHTFEKKCVQCNTVITPEEYAKNGVICGHCWKSNFKS